jgi:hypothetical protein
MTLAKVADRVADTILVVCVVITSPLWLIGLALNDFAQRRRVRDFIAEREKIGEH